MAWNTEETRQRLREAATEEFAASGLHGTTMDRIARRAGINKERLYHYFGDKEQLFAAVLSDELARAAAAVPVESLREADLGEYAGRVFDYHARRPQLMRLLHWEALSYHEGPLPDEEARTSYYQQKAAALAAGQRDGAIAADPDARHLLFLILAVSTWWFGAPQLARMITGANDGDSAERDRRRAAVVTAARRIAATLPAPPS